MYHHQGGHRQDRGRVSATLPISSLRSHSSASQTPLLTASPLLFHPVPTRPALLQLLHRQSPDSDNADSTFAQIGAERPAVPPSQAEENDVWRDFVAGPDEISASTATETSDDLKDAAQRPISPGVSQFGTSRQLQDRCEATAAVSPALGGIDETFPDHDQVAPNAGDDSPKEQNMRAGSSDEVSLLATTSSPKLSSSFDVVDEVKTIEMTQPEDNGSVEKELPSGCKQEDENDMWRNFVFGESSENLEKALEEARRDTARSLRPPLSSTSIYSCDESQKDAIISSLNSDLIDRRDSAEEVCDPTRDAFSTASVSHLATAWTSSSAELSSEATSGSMNTAVRTDRATQGSSGSSSANGNNTGRLLFPDDLVTPSVCETDTGPPTSSPEQLEKNGEADDGFKFARPKLFVGKKIGQVDEQRQIALSAPQIRRTTQTHHRQRQATNRRANIRKLPNYGSDPIEEFEGDVRSDRAEKGSMFGPLETENGL